MMLSPNRSFLLTSIAAIVVLLSGALPITATQRRRPVRRPAEFRNPELVTILGWEDDTMEPFITRDGRHLLFNNSNDPSVDTNLHYAERIDDTTFRYRGEIIGVNTPALEGVASVDLQGTIYFVSTRSYATSLSTLYRGRFESGFVSDVELVPGVSRLEPGIVNFDAEISPDGNFLYFVDGRFSGTSYPDSADLVIAVRDETGFTRMDEPTILASVNTTGLEYAPAVSVDGLEIFFTRLEIGGEAPTIGIWRAKRVATDQPFEQPTRIRAIEGFVEAPTLSPDESSIYYHKKEGSRFVIYRVSR